MSGQHTAPEQPDRRAGGTPPGDNRADTAYRRAWWALLLYPVSFVAAFVIGEGLFAILTDGEGEGAGDAAGWQVLVAAVPALVVFVIPGILSVIEGRRAMRLGRRDGSVPAIVGATVGLGFVGVNLLSYVVGLVAG